MSSEGERGDGCVGKAVLGVRMKLGGLAAFLSLGSSPKPKAGFSPQALPAPGMVASQGWGQGLLLEQSRGSLDGPCPLCRGRPPAKSQALEGVHHSRALEACCVSHMPALPRIIHRIGTQ